MNEIDHWQKKFEQERKSRIAAEELLENKSLELSKRNQDLEKIIQERTHALQDALEIAKEANKSKKAFLANMSHEVRTPLNAILGFASILQKSELPTKEKNYIDIINASADNLLNIVNDILDFSKIQSGKMELEEDSFVAEDLINIIYSLFVAKAKEKNIEYKIHTDHAIPECLIGDHHRLHQVLSNLIGNAIKFTPDHKNITLSCTLLEKDSLSARIRFSVEDTGIGIPEEKQSQIFSAFSQADSSLTRTYGGTGLGLSISSQLVAMMGSKLHLKSEVDKGTTFWFDLNMPICDFLKKQEHTSSYDPDSHSYGNASILVAEDTPFNQELVKALLEERGINHFMIANDGTEAVKLFKEKQFDLILMDINMPNMDGVSATNEIRKIEAASGRESSIPIIALTANAIQGDRERFIDAMMDDYLIKPIEIDELDRVLSHYLVKKEQKTSIDPKRLPYSLDVASKHLQLPKEKIKPIALRFIESIFSELDHLQQSIEEKNLENIYAFAHRIKGSAANFHMEHLAAAAFQLEQSVNAYDLDKLMMLYTALEAEIEQVKKDLKSEI